MHWHQGICTTGTVTIYWSLCSCPYCFSEVDETVILEQHDADTSVNYLELHKLGEVLHDISLKLPGKLLCALTFQF